jgi:hypothetical protein
MPSHAFRSPWASGPATNTGPMHTLGRKKAPRLGGGSGGALHVTFCLAVGQKPRRDGPVPERSSSTLTGQDHRRLVPSGLNEPQDRCGRLSKSVAERRRKSTKSSATRPCSAGWASPQRLASIYVQLAADDASFATGNIYGSGGGQGQP